MLTRSPAVQLPDPHPASAAVRIDGTTYCSSILPWRSCGDRPPWLGGRHVDKTIATVAVLDAALPRGPLVWGGDWNHALGGSEHAGSVGGRRAITAMIAGRGLQVPTGALPHRVAGLLSIDHIAVGADLPIDRAYRFVAAGLSDHDGYIVELAGGPHENR